MTQESSTGVNNIANGAKLIGETLIPGASLLMDGQFVNGAVHAAVGTVARLALGPVGLFLVCADSFSKSTTDKTLWDHISAPYKEHAAKKEAEKAVLVQAGLVTP